MKYPPDYWNTDAPLAIDESDDEQLVAITKRQRRVVIPAIAAPDTLAIVRKDGIVDSPKKVLRPTTRPFKKRQELPAVPPIDCGRKLRAKEAAQRRYRPAES